MVDVTWLCDWPERDGGWDVVCELDAVYGAGEYVVREVWLVVARVEWGCAVCVLGWVT